MGNFSYITNRTLQNRAGEEKGRVAILVRTGSMTAEYKYTCPECGDQRDGQQEFRRPRFQRKARPHPHLQMPTMNESVAQA